MSSSGGGGGGGGGEFLEHFWQGRTFEVLLAKK